MEKVEQRYMFQHRIRREVSDVSIPGALEEEKKGPRGQSKHRVVKRYVGDHGCCAHCWRWGQPILRREKSVRGVGNSNPRSATIIRKISNPQGDSLLKFVKSECES